jgi:hypothetical protein
VTVDFSHHLLFGHQPRWPFAHIVDHILLFGCPSSLTSLSYRPPTSPAKNLSLVNDFSEQVLTRSSETNYLFEPLNVISFDCDLYLVDLRFYISFKQNIIIIFSL